MSVLLLIFLASSAQAQTQVYPQVTIASAPVTVPVSGTVTTEPGVNTTTVTVSGTVTVDGSGVTQPVSGTFWQTTQPISGTVTTEPGVNTTTVTVSGTVAVDGSGVTQPVSGTFWQATQPVSGTVTTEPGVGTTTVTVSGSVAATKSGTWTLDANDGTDIGNVDVASIAAGDNNIGNVDVVTLPALTQGGSYIGQVHISSAITAGTNRLGGVYPISGQHIDEGGSVRTSSTSFVNTDATSGYTEIVAAQGAGLKVRALAAQILCEGAATLAFASNAQDELITSSKAVVANGGLNYNYNPSGWANTSANEGFGINLSAGATCGVDLTWMVTNQ